MLDGVIARVAARQKDELSQAMDHVLVDPRMLISRKTCACGFVSCPRQPTGGQSALRSSFGLPERRNSVEGRKTSQPSGRGARRWTLSAAQFARPDRAETPQQPRCNHRPQDRQESNNLERTSVIGGGSCCSPCCTAWPSKTCSAPRRVTGVCSFCTRRVASPSTRFRLNDANRRVGMEALEIIDRAIELGFLPAAPQARAARGATSAPSADRTKYAA